MKALKTIFLAAISLLILYVPAKAEVEVPEEELLNLMTKGNYGNEFLLTFHPCWQTNGQSFIKI